jgi:hypothetical protein
MSYARWIFWLDMKNQNNAAIFQNAEYTELVAAMMPFKGE